MRESFLKDECYPDQALTVYWLMVSLSFSQLLTAGLIHVQYFTDSERRETRKEKERLTAALRENHMRIGG